MTPVELSVAPLRDKAIQAAESVMRETLEKIRHQLEAADWDLLKVAPYPHTRMDRKSYVSAKSKFNFFDSLVTRNDPRQIVIYAKELLVTWDEAKAQRVIEDAKVSAAFSYDKYVKKLNAKIGDHTEAKLRNDSNLWYSSFLDVTLPSGEVVCWKTQMIVNVSSLGKLFNQWPTRIVKK